MQNITQVDSSADHPPPAATETAARECAGLTLVVQPPGRVAAKPSAITLSLNGPEPRVVQSFPEACTVLLSERVAVVLLIDDPNVRFSERELDVIGKLAGSASIVLVQPWQALEVRSRGGSAQADEPGRSADQSRSLTVGRLQYNSVFGCFKVGGRLLKFSHAETRLLLDVITAPGHCISVAALVNGGGATGEQRSEGVVRQFVYRIRRKLADAGDPAFLVSTRSGYGLLSPGTLADRRYSRHRGTPKVPASHPALHSEAEGPSALHAAALEPSCEGPAAPQSSTAQAYG